MQRCQSSNRIQWNNSDEPFLAFFFYSIKPFSLFFRFTSYKVHCKNNSNLFKNLAHLLFFLNLSSNFVWDASRQRKYVHFLIYIIIIKDKLPDRKRDLSWELFQKSEAAAQLRKSHFNLAKSGFASEYLELWFLTRSETACQKFISTGVSKRLKNDQQNICLASETFLISELVQQVNDENLLSLTLWARTQN